MKTEAQRNLGFIEQALGVFLIADAFIGGPVSAAEAVFGAAIYIVGTHTRG